MLPLKSESLCVNSCHRRCSVKKAVLKNFLMFTGKHLCWSLFSDKVAGLQASCEYWKIFKNIYCEEHLQMAASSVRSEHSQKLCDILKLLKFSVSFVKNEITLEQKAE